MSKTGKIASLAFLLLLVVTSLVMTESGAAQSTAKPSVPEFTVTVTDHSYDVQTTTTTITDPYDGHITTQTTPGYHAVNGSIELSIKNQPFTPYYASNGYPIKLYYHFRAKGLDVNWYNSGDVPNSDTYFEATNSTHTTLQLRYTTHFFEFSGGLVGYRTDGTIDFQVEAFIGYKNVTHIRPSMLVTRPDDLRTEFVGQTSGWSQSQTATIPNGAYTPSTPIPTTSPAPTAPTLTATPSPYQDPTATSAGTLIEFSFTGPQWDLIELALFMVVGLVFAFLVAVVFFMRRKIRILQSKRNGT